ncbi:MAG: two-component system response regulator [Alphaproteobacteria bacterium HGW-Alphaproteobacteria-5]|nr:MAG: two-component system response regulator [Alphaproteobacteria bacterium HGW-Alphaproteobacteria-5]
MAIDMNKPILIVDDYRTMLRIIGGLLSKLGFTHIDEAIDGTDAFAKLKSRDYGFVISDWNMVPMSGFELLKKVRADEQLKSLPFIMVTAEAKSENVVAARKAGVNNYIIKPFSGEVLKAKLKTVLGDF